MAVNLVLTAITGSPYHNSIIDSGTTALIDENIPDQTKIAELTGFDSSRMPPSGSYRIVIVEDYGGLFTVVKENGKWYLVAVGNDFNYESEDFAGEYPGITFQFRDSTDVNETGQILQQLAVGVRLNDVPEAANGAPSIAVTGTTAFTATNQAGVDAFDNVTISDAEASDTITLTITFNATDGSLVGLNGQAIPTPTTSGNNKVYTFTGTKAALTSALHDIQFDPADRAAGGGAVVTTLTIGVSDPDHTTPVTNSQITVSSTPPAAPNGAPSIAVTGTTAFTATNQAGVDAFDNVTISDAEASDTITLTITFNGDDGSLVGLNGQVIPAPATSGNNKIYTFTGTKAALTSALHDIQFDPAHRAAGGAAVVTTLTIGVSDPDNATPVTNSQITVSSTPPAAVNSAPAGLSLSNGFVLEYAAAGTDIGVLNAVDQNGDALTYKLLDNAGGRFAIVGNKLVLAGPGVNFEDAKSHQIKVQVSDGHAGVSEQSFTISVGDQLTLSKRGKSKNDKMNGTNLDDLLKGGSGTGKDMIKGLAGDDKLYGEGGDDKLYGGDGIDTLYGGKGNDILKGDAGNDVLFGEAGNDKLYGGTGSDAFVFNKKANKKTDFDRIYDFKSGEDKIFLENSVFKKLGKLGTFDAPAQLNLSMFGTNKAKDKNDHLVYKSGVLYYDADGSGKGAAVEIVKLKGLKVSDIFVI